MRVRHVLGDAEFAKYWDGQTFSVFGSNIAGFALVLLATYFLEASPRELGWLQAMSGFRSCSSRCSSGGWLTVPAGFGP